MIYNISKQKLSNKEFNKELLKDLERAISRELNNKLFIVDLALEANKSNKDLVKNAFINNNKVIQLLYKAYINNKIVQVILTIKEISNRKLFLFYKNAKIKLEDYEVFNNLLYIVKRLYISNNLELQIKIINKLYKSRLRGYKRKIVIYIKVSKYYYQLRIIDII